MPQTQEQALMMTMILTTTMTTMTMTTMTTTTTMTMTVRCRACVSMRMLVHSVHGWWPSHAVWLHPLVSQHTGGHGHMIDTEVHRHYLYVYNLSVQNA